MKTKIKINQRDIKIILIAVIAGLFFGWLFFHGSGSETPQNTAESTTQQEQATVWTCSMHPQIRMDHPGQCPICGMDLIPLDELSASESAVSPSEIKMTEAAVKIADVQTMVVKKPIPTRKFICWER